MAYNPAAMEINEVALLHILHDQTRVIAALLESHIKLVHATTGALNPELPEMLATTRSTVRRLESFLQKKDGE
jgi:hypothetical protein